jgi:uncharacterized membrane protein
MFAIIVILMTKVPLVTKNKRKRLCCLWFFIEKLVVAHCLTIYKNATKIMHNIIDPITILDQVEDN